MYVFIYISIGVYIYIYIYKLSVRGYVRIGRWVDLCDSAALGVLRCVMQHVAACSSVVQSGVVCCSVLRCVAVCAWAHVTVLFSCCKSVFPCFVGLRNPVGMLELEGLWFCVTALLVVCCSVCCSVLQCVAVCCSVLQYVAVCRSLLQCVAVCCSVLQCVSVWCGVLQCVAVCCMVLQMIDAETFATHIHTHVIIHRRMYVHI